MITPKTRCQYLLDEQETQSCMFEDARKYSMNYKCVVDDVEVELMHCNKEIEAPNGNDSDLSLSPLLPTKAAFKNLKGNCSDMNNLPNCNPKAIELKS